MKKFTKIICTIGPACDSKECIQKLFDAGMNVARLNFSHGNYDYFLKLIKDIRSVSSDIGILLDTKGPEVRSGDIEGDFIELKDNQKLILTKKKIIGNFEKITINYKHLGDLEIGNEVLIDDGLIGAKVIGTDNGEIIVKVLNGGKLGSKKTVTIRGHNVKIPFLSKKDIQDIEFGIENNLDFIAASFVREAKEITRLKRILDKNNSNIKIISKIEHPLSVDNFGEILDVSDGIMIARGDLGVEIKPELVPWIQKDMIEKCRNLGKPVIVATHMLESMKENPRPTRAEVSDVAQAIMQGTDAIMLSGETASGKYPVKSVQMMTRIAKIYDNRVRYPITENLNDVKKKVHDTTLFITNAVYHASKNLGIKAILVPTASGFTARGISRFRPNCPIYAVTSDETVVRQLALSRNVFAFSCLKSYKDKTDMSKALIKNIFDKGLVNKEDKVIITAGLKIGEKGYTNMLEVYRVNDIF